MADLPKKLVYVSGPASAIEATKTIVLICEKLGLEVYLSQKEDVEKAFDKNIHALEKAEIIVLNLMGEDAGTSWEAGYAVARGKTPIGICKADSSISLMIKASVFIINSSVDDLTHAIETLRDTLLYQDAAIKDRNKNRSK